MSGLHDGAPDPLAALRSSDRRPRAEVLRERLFSGEFVHRFSHSSPRWTASVSRVAVAVLVCALGAAIGWRLFVESEPPVEASIPFATGALDTAIEPSGQGDPNASGAVAETIVDSQAPFVSEAGTNPQGEEPATIPDNVVVHVAGAVSRPGLIRGDASWRIDDAVRAAGGPDGEADLDRVNLAAPILDGQRIFVPFVDAPIPSVIEPETPLVGGDAAALINLNTADAIELQTLPGIGPATAAAIVSHRDDFGPFGTVDALVAVAGIGPATLESLREHVGV